MATAREAAHGVVALNHHLDIRGYCVCADLGAGHVIDAALEG